MIALALQLCPHDEQEAIDLATLIAEVEPRRREDAEFIVSYRRDTKPAVVKEICDTLHHRFDTVIPIRGTSRANGWPTGPNEQWQETNERAFILKRDGKLSAKWLLTFEADCVMLRPDWIDQLKSETERGEQAGKWIVGHAHYFPKDPSNPEILEEEPNHINGNALFKIGICKTHTWLDAGSPTAGWDAYHGKKMLRIGMDTPCIYQLYRMRAITREQLEGIRKQGEIPALFHGLKKSIGIPIVREMMEDGSFYERIKTANA